jgi:hypothetical protein
MSNVWETCHGKRWHRFTPMVTGCMACTYVEIKSSEFSLFTHWTRQALPSLDWVKHSLHSAPLICWVKVIGILSTYLHNRLCIASVEILDTKCSIIHPANESKHVAVCYFRYHVDLGIHVLEPTFYHRRCKSSSFNPPTEAEESQISFTVWWQWMP